MHGGWTLDEAWLVFFFFKNLLFSVVEIFKTEFWANIQELFNFHSIFNSEITAPWTKRAQGDLQNCFYKRGTQWHFVRNWNKLKIRHFYSPFAFRSSTVSQERFLWVLFLLPNIHINMEDYLKWFLFWNSRDF